MKTWLAALAVLLISVNAFADATESARCAQAGDSLDIPSAINRSKWALKCYASLSGLADDNGQFMLKDTATGAVKVGYPIFAEYDANGKRVRYIQAPTDPNAPCPDINVIKVAGICVASCFTPDQQILFRDGYMSIGEAAKLKRQDILVAGQPLGGRPTMRPGVLQSYVVDYMEYDHVILQIRTAEDITLKVTPNHPLVDGEGFMRAASTLKAGDRLMNANGDAIAIEDIQRTNYFGKVYNVDMGSADLLENVILAQNYLSGTVYYQNEGVKDLNRQILRLEASIPESLFK